MYDLTPKSPYKSKILSKMLLPCISVNDKHLSLGFVMLSLLGNFNATFFIHLMLF